MKKTKLILLTVLNFILIGCSTQNNQTIRIDSKKIHALDAEYGIEDLHIFTNSMLQSMLRSPLFKTDKINIFIGDIQLGKGINEHIDTKLLEKSIQSNLLNSTKVNISSKKNLSQYYLLAGTLHALKKNTLNRIDNYYLFTLNLTDNQTSIIKWSDEKEIRKVVFK
jgi:PBP1b-binding outer membrane lipoprotein LpoB